jgi:hypothetical protein
MPAPKGNLNAAGNKGGGRKTIYKDEYTRIGHSLALLGATDAEIAEALDVAETTINAWKRRHVEFFEALKSGKSAADAQVAQSLYHRALGYSHPEDKIFNNNGVALVVPTTKHYPPDTTAAIFWLKNRQSAKWRDKQEHEHSGRDGGPIQTKTTFQFVGVNASTDTGPGQVPAADREKEAD